MIDENKFTDSTTDILGESGQESTDKKLGEKAWFVVNTYSTHENKVKTNLERRVESMGIQDYVFRIIVAEQEVPVIDKETKLPTGKTRMKNLYPGYVFVEMIMTDHAWYVVRNTPGVTGFVGSSGKGTKPFPIPREQIEPVLKKMGIIDESMYTRYSIGSLVTITSGAFEGQEGTIVGIDKDTNTVTIETIFFGRKNRVEADFTDIEQVK